MVNHGISTGMLFVVVGMLVTRGGSRLIRDYGGCVEDRAAAGGPFLLAGLSSLALPGHQLVRLRVPGAVGSYPREPVFTILATCGIIFAALYVLWVYQQTMQARCAAPPYSARSSAAVGPAR
jgi:NADH-quinone oxidoreductase subunit M